MARYRLLSQLDRLGDGASVSDLAAAIGEERETIEDVRRVLNEEFERE